MKLVSPTWEQRQGDVAIRWLDLRRVLRLLPVVLLGGCLLFGAGCTTPGMKGTPFYTGEPSEQEKLAMERVYVWPLLYYRSPGLSVCWPLFTSYGLEPSSRVYNVVWPLAQFDRQEHQNRIFPYFWGGGADPADDYRIGFPLYWHFGHPCDKEVGGLDALFPLWCVDRQGPDQSSVYCPWPLVHFMHNGPASGWYIFPLAGSYGDGNGYFRFQAAFLADQWGNEREQRQNALVFPLYFYGRNKDIWDFYSLPWSGGHETDRDWSCLLPVYYHRTNTTGALFLSPLWLQGSSAQPADGGWAVLVPLVYHSHSAQGATTLSPLWLSHTAADTNQTSWSALVPVYYHSANKDSEVWLTPLWMQGRSANPAEGGWSALFPLAYHSYNDKSATTLSPLWLSHTAADTNQTSWSALLPVYYHSASKDSAVWLTPLWMQGASANPAEGGWSALFPLAYHSYNDKSATTLSPLWFSHTAADSKEKSWSALLPVYYHGTQQGSDLLLTPLWAQSTRSNVSWQCQLPFYFARQEGADQFWATPLGGLRTAAGQKSWMIYPLLSWGQPRADGGEFWALAPLIHADWNASNSVSHVLPVYYYNSRTHTALSPLWARWTERGTTHALVPPLLSWVSNDAASSDLWLALGLGKFSWGAQPGSQYLLPLFYQDREKQQFLSPVWARWASGGTTNTVVPPTLSWVSSDAASSDLWLALGLGKFSWGAHPGSQYLMPLFYQDRERQQFLSLLWAGWPTADGHITALPPALSWKETHPERSDLHLLLFLGQFSWGDKPSAQYLLPFFYQNSSAHTFLSPVWAQWLSSGGTNTAVPLALSWLTADEQRKNLWLALGLGKFSWGDRPTSSYLLPFYYRNPQTHECYTPLFGRDPGADGFTYYATPLVGQRQGAHTGSWAFPLYSHKREVQSGDIDDWLLWGNHWERGGVSRSIFIPIFGYHNFGPLDHAPEVAQDRLHYGKDFFCIPYCWYRNETYLSPAPEERPRPIAPARVPASAPVREDKFTHGVFPLWSYANVEKPAQGQQTIDGSCLLWLYTYNREVSPLAHAPAGRNDFTCARFLWHFWYYERLNGDVSVDLFPGITYDRKRDGFQKYSWLWRVFRYERAKDGGRKLDLLFIPCMRSAGGSK